MLTLKDGVAKNTSALEVRFTIHYIQNIFLHLYCDASISMFE